MLLSAEVFRQPFLSVFWVSGVFLAYRRSWARHIEFADAQHKCPMSFVFCFVFRFWDRWSAYKTTKEISDDTAHRAVVHSNNDNEFHSDAHAKPTVLFPFFLTKPTVFFTAVKQRRKPNWEKRNVRLATAKTKASGQALRQRQPTNSLERKQANANNLSPRLLLRKVSSRWTRLCFCCFFLLHTQHSTKKRKSTKQKKIVQNEKKT